MHFLEITDLTQFNSSYKYKHLFMRHNLYWPPLSCAFIVLVGYGRAFHLVKTYTTDSLHVI